MHILVIVLCLFPIHVIGNPLNVTRDSPQMAIGDSTVYRGYRPIYDNSVDSIRELATKMTDREAFVQTVLKKIVDGYLPEG